MAAGGPVFGAQVRRRGMEPSKLGLATWVGWAWTVFMANQEFVTVFG